MRLIDADELKKDIDGYDYSEEGYSDRMDFKFIYEVIDNQPTVEAKPVVHGKWVHGYNCSECGWSYMDYADADSYPASGNPLPNFCGNCGADMRKKVE